MLLTFGGAIVLRCELVASVMCWAGALPAMLGRSLGVWLGALALHCALLPLVNAALFVLGFLLGAARRAAELGLLAARACQPAARCSSGCGGGGGERGQGAQQQQLLLPRHALPALPAAFPPTSPPAHRYREGPPPPWWTSNAEGERAYRACAASCCLEPCAYDSEGTFTYPCCPKWLRSCTVNASWLGVYLIILCLQNGLALLLLVPLAAAAAAFLASLLYIPAGALSVLVSCWQWEGHVYTVLPRLAERAGVVAGERAVDAAAAALTAAVLAPLYCAVACGAGRRAGLTPWALVWARTLRTGASVPPWPPAPEKSARGGVVMGVGQQQDFYEQQQQQQQYYQQQQQQQQQYNQQQQQQQQQQQYLPAVLLQPGQALQLTTGSGRSIVIQTAQTLYAPLGIASYSSWPGTSIWSGASYYPPPPPLPPPQQQQQQQQQPPPPPPSGSSGGSFMTMPRMLSFRSAAALSSSSSSSSGTGSGGSSGALTGAAMPPAPPQWAGGEALQQRAAEQAAYPDPLGDDGGACQAVPSLPALPPLPPLPPPPPATAGQCRGCSAPLAPGAYTEACTGGHRVCSSCYCGALQHPRGCNLGADALPGVRSWEALVQCPWGASDGSACALAAQPADGAPADALLPPPALARLRCALALREACSSAAHGCAFKPCARTPACAGLVFSALPAPGVEAMAVWSVCGVCGESEPAAEAVAAVAVGAAPAPEPAAPALPPAVPQWPSFLFSVGELPFSLPQGLVSLVVAQPPL